MQGIQNFLFLINDNWMNIVVTIGLILTIYKKATTYFSKSKEEKIAIAKAQIKERMLKMITDAEVDFHQWKQAGSIKRSQVIGEIFKNYPILAKSIDQQEVIHWIDQEINLSLETLKKVVTEKRE